jgi:N-alpha-acetyltransferase 15/16, NatA auxiliary subunit
LALPLKGSGSFPDYQKLYETKKYRKGLKDAQSILDKHPAHAETLAMKALFLYNLGDKTEAMGFAKQVRLRFFFRFPSSSGHYEKH